MFVGVHKTSERRHCLQLADHAGLDVTNITKTVVENIRRQDDSSAANYFMDVDGADGGDITKVYKLIQTYW